MYDFLGWFATTHTKNNPSELVKTIFSTCQNLEIHELFTLASGKNGEIGKKGDTTALVTGNPRWRNDGKTGSSRDTDIAASIAAAFQKEGPEFLQRLTGTFSVAVFDSQTKQGLLAIDRMGVFPLAYAATAEALVFSGDINLLTAHPAINTRPNPQALMAYLYFHMIPAPLSIYEGIDKLLPGHYLHWNKGNITIHRYWLPRFEAPSRNERELATELRRKLQTAVSDALPGKESPGTFLSGGLDSSTVTGLCRRLHPETEAFSIGFSAKGYDEMEYARAAARHFGVPLREYYVTPEDVVKAISLIAKNYDEPFGNASAVPTYYCALLARNHGKIHLLAGDGGDELFAGNERYGKQKMFALYQNIPSWMRTYFIEPVVQRLPSISIAGKLKSYVDQAKTPMPDRMETYNFLHRSPLEKIFEQDFLASIDHHWPLSHIREIYNAPATDSMLKRMLYLDWKITLADNDLRKVNRMCTQAGVDVRYPMLDMSVVDLAATIPDRMLMKGFELRSFYRNTFRDFLPSTTLEKRKHGFGLPFGLWLQSNPALQEIAYDSLGSRHFSGIIRRDYLDYLKNQHKSGHASYYGVMIWVLMMWSQWADSHH